MRKPKESPKQKPKIETVYGDSCFFIAAFNNEVGRVQTCVEVIKAAREKRIRLVTSFTTIAECSLRSASETQRDQVGAFFDNDFIEKVNVDWWVANKARHIQTLGSDKRIVKPLDAIHLATAMLEGADATFTYDKGLLRLDGESSLGNLHICEPDCYWDRLIVPTTGMFAIPPQPTDLDTQVAEGDEEDTDEDTDYIDEDEEDEGYGTNPTRTIII